MGRSHLINEHALNREPVPLKILFIIWRSTRDDFINLKRRGGIGASTNGKQVQEEYTYEAT